jgi:WD40 repeat protein
MTITPIVPEIERNYFVVGGTLPPDAPSYIGRKADTDLYTHLMAGDFCYVLTSRQMGKSSLMVRTAVRLREVGCRVATLDLTEIGKNVTPDQWYNGLLVRLGRALGLDKQLKEYRLQADQNLGALQRWLAAIRNVVIASIPNNIVVFVDEIDGVRSLPFVTDEFFEGIRNFYTDRATHPELNRITFCLVGVATPSDLIQNLSTTPFNIGYRVALSDFTKQEAAPLIQGLDHPPKVASALLRRVLWWTGGHPYLTQRLCAAVAEDATVTSAAGVDRLCTKLFLSSRSRETDNNLQFVGRRISDRADQAELAALLDLYGRVCAGKRVPDDDTNRLIGILRLAGVVKVEANRLAVRNRIYARVFDQDWIRAHMPDAEIRRQRAAFRKGVLRAAGLALAIFAVIGWLGFKELADQQRVAIERYCANMIQVQQDFDNGDYASGAGLLRETQPNVRTGPRESEKLLAQIPLLNRALPFISQHRDLYALLNGFDDKADAHFEWDYLRARSYGDSALMYYGHTDEIRSVDISSDGKLLATAGADSTVRIFDISGINYPDKNPPRLVGALAVVDSSGNAKPILPPPDGAESWSVDCAVKQTFDKLDNVALGHLIGDWDRSKCPDSNVKDPQNPPHVPGVMSVKFSPDGKWLAVGTGTWRSPQDPGNVYLWSTTDPGYVHPVKTNHSRAIDTVVFRGKTTEFATTSEDNTAEFFMIAGEAPHEKVTLVGQFDASQATTKGMNAAAFSPSGKTFAMIFGDGHLWIKGDKTKPISADVSGLMTIAFYDEYRILLGTRDGHVELFNLRDKTQKARTYLETGQGLVTSLTVSRDRDLLLTTGSSGTVLVWKLLKDPHNGELIDVVRYPGDSIVLGGERDVAYSAAMTPDQHLIASGGSDTLPGSNGGHIYLWLRQPTPGAENKPTWISQPSYIPANGAVQALAFSPETQVCPEAQRGIGNDKKPKSLPVSQEIASIRGFSTPASTPEIEFTHLDPCSGKPKEPHFVPVPSQSATAGSALAWSPDGKIVASALNDGTVQLWDPVNYSQRPLELPKDICNQAIPILALSYSPEGLLAGAGPDGSIFLWKPAESLAVQSVLQEAPRARPNPSSAQESRASGAMQNPKTPGQPGQHATAVCPTVNAKPTSGFLLLQTLAFSPAGHWLAVCESDKKVHIWDTASLSGAAPNAAPKSSRIVLTGTEYKETHKPPDPSGELQGQCTAAAFSPDGRWLAIGTIYHEIAVWSTDNWKRLEGELSYGSIAASESNPGSYPGHHLDVPPKASAAINSLAFSPDSRRLAYGTADAKIYLWDVTAQLPLPVITVHSGGVLTLAFSPDGRCLASGSNDQTLRFTCDVDENFLDHRQSLPPSAADRFESVNWLSYQQ